MRQVVPWPSRCLWRSHPSAAGPGTPLAARPPPRTARAAVPAFGEGGGVVVRRVARDLHGDGCLGALAAEGAAAEVRAALAHALVDGRMDGDGWHGIPLVSQRLSLNLLHEKVTTLRIDSPACMRSKAWLIRSSGIWCVISGSMLILPSMYQSTIRGTSVRPRAPPKAVPFQTRPVTSWKGRVLISWPDPATPMITETPQPRWQHSTAWRISSTFPTHSKL